MARLLMKSHAGTVVICVNCNLKTLNYFHLLDHQVAKLLLDPSLSIC